MRIKNIVQRRAIMALRLCLYTLILILCFVNVAAKGLSQTSFNLLCGDLDISGTQLPNPFPGAFYHILSGDGDIGEPYRFERISQIGRTEIIAPFAPEQAQNLITPRISPDESLMVFRPSDSSTPLTVWDITTDEVVTLMLTLEEFEAFRGLRPYDQYFDKLIWRDSNHLIIQAFYDNDYRHVIWETEIIVSQNPLQLIRGTHSEIVYPSLPVPSQNIYRSTHLSTSGNYSLLRSLAPVEGHIPLQHWQIYDINNNLVFDLPPSQQSSPVGNPIWTLDDSRLFYIERLSSDSTLRLVELIPDEGFIEATELHQTLETTFGSSFGLSSEFNPLISPDGESIGFSFFNQNQNQPYVVRYSWATGTIDAVCRERLNSGGIYPFWTPNERFFAYWTDANNVIVSDFVSGNRYVLPSRNFVGWVDTAN